MAENDEKKASLLKTRIFLLLFFGLAILLSVTTILGTWEGQREGVIDPATLNNPAASPK
jgi:hypothetical protein